MPKPVRSKETSPRARRPSERRDVQLHTRVTAGDAAAIATALPGVSPADRLRALAIDAVTHKEEAEALCKEWTEAQRREDWGKADMYAAVIAQTYRLRTLQFAERLRALTQPADAAPIPSESPDE
jgi:hypothetical protein